MHSTPLCKIVVYISRRGLVPGLGHPRILSSFGLHHTDGRRDQPPAADLGSSESHTAVGCGAYYSLLSLLALARLAGDSAWGSWAEASCIHEGA